MRRRMLGGLAAAAALTVAGGALAQTPAQPPALRNDYGRPETWLCRPGRKDACAVDLTATVVKADGTLTPEPFKAAAAPGIDCFYVYPTVSTDPTGNSDMSIDAAERRVVDVQFARFAQACRPFAPMYRQITLAALRGFMTGKPIPADRALAYRDVKDAWDWYMAHENKGRGVVLVGHSQGAGVLAEFIKREIDGKPAQKLLVSALLIGTNVPAVDGKYGSVPVCTAESQTGCLIAYVSFRDTAPPPASSLFGKVATPGAKAACVNPGALGGGSGPLHSYLWNSTGAGTSGAAPSRPWVSNGAVTTPFVSVPGLLSAQCVDKDGFSYLSVHVAGDPADARTDDISGDVMAMAAPDPNWGLHLVDMNIAQGDLVRIVGAQAKAWKKK